MIDTKELRPGNEVFWNEKQLHRNVNIKPMPIQLTEILPDKVAYIQPHREYRVEFFDDALLAKEKHYLMLEELQPIPLTEEWLLKFKFTKANENNYSITAGESKLLSIKKNSEGFYYENSAQKIEYVHQLQNIYFGVTGKELQINE